jgi:hypothetical protein
MNIWECFEWWECSLEEINTQMHKVSNNALTKKNKR